MTRFIIKNKIITGLLAAAFWLLVWQAAYIKVAQELLLVSPMQAFARLFALAETTQFWISVLGTCLRVVVGFLLSLVTGALLAWLSFSFRLIHILISPLFGVIRATPVASFIILVLLWLRTDTLPMFIAFLMVVPIVWANISAGISSTDQSLLEMARIFRFSRGKTARWIYAPAIAPHFISACSVGLGFAWKSAVAAEVICLPKYAIGRQFYNAKIYLETADLFAWTIAVIILSVLIEKLFIGALKGIQKHHA